MLYLRHALIACLLPCAFAQSPAPVFVAADVHPSGGNGTTGFRINLFSGGRYQIRNATLVDLIATAWGLHHEMISGGPPWIATDRFDVIAQIPENAAPDDLRLMLRAVLTERFGLVTHDDRKPVPVFALLRGTRSLTLAPSAADSPGRCNENFESGPSAMASYACTQTTMAEFAARLRNLDSSVTRPAVDLTGLPGAFDFTVKFTPLFDYQRAAAAGESAPGVKLFDALEKMGLRIEPREQELPVLAIDRVNRIPSPNPPGTAERLPAVVEEFEVAEVKPSKLTEGSVNFGSNGVVEIMGYTLKDLMRYVWDVAPERMVGAPKWFDIDRYDIVAKGPRNSSADDLLVMLRPLLTERFQMVTHTEDRPAAVFVLTAMKNPKLKPADPSERSECVISRGQTGGGASAMPLKVYTCRNTSMGRFAQLIKAQAAGYFQQQPVLDQTGLKGGFDFTLSWTRGDVLSAAQRNTPAGADASEPTGGITVFEAVEHDLGLKLEGGKKAPMPVLVIDSIVPIRDR
jgi:uncharacterized protein (TIGR03435 family)